MRSHVIDPNDLFQPTLPLRGATVMFDSSNLEELVSTHAPLAGSDAAGERSDPLACVSTHAPLAGSDNEIPVRREYDNVSTHAPLAGSDARLAAVNVRPPRFQPTLPLRGATAFHTSYNR